MTPFDIVLWVLTVVLVAAAAFDGWLLAEQLEVFRKLHPSLFLNAVAGLLAGGYAAGFCRSLLGLDLLLQSPPTHWQEQAKAVILIFCPPAVLISVVFYLVSHDRPRVVETPDLVTVTGGRREERGNREGTALADALETVLA